MTAGCPYDPLAADPYPQWAHRPPVFQDGALGLWSVTGYDAVLAVLRDTETFSSAEAFALRGFPRPRMLVAMDPPEHTPLRKLMQRAFTPRRVAALEPWIEATCHGLADGLHGEVDLMAAYANALPLRVITQILGFDAADAPRLRRWTEDFLVLATPAGAEGEADAARVARMRATIDDARALVRARRREPRDDVISALAAAGTDLDDDHLVTLALELVIAGNDTTANLIAHMVGFLLADRSRWDAVRADRTLVPHAVEETLRRRGSSKGLFRRATRDVELGGETIPAGAIVHVLFAAAGHDAERFPDPRAFDLERANAGEHVSFGRWTHFCLGAPLARLEARVALNVLLDRIPELREPPQVLEYAPTLTTQTLLAYRVVC